MVKATLDYQRRRLANTASGGLGFIAMVFAFTGIAFQVTMFMGLPNRIGFAVFGITSAVSMLLSIVIGSAALFRAGRPREWGFAAIAVSVVWLLLVFVLYLYLPSVP